MWLLADVAPLVETGGSAKLSFCFMNRGFSVVGMETRPPCAGNIERMNLMASLSQLSRRQGAFLLGKTGPERAGEEPGLAQQVTDPGVEQAAVGGCDAVRIPPTSAGRVGRPAGGFLGLRPVFF